MNDPLPWHPAIVDVQIITIGSFAVVAVPGEFTWVVVDTVHKATVTISEKVSLYPANAILNPFKNTVVIL